MARPADTYRGARRNAWRAFCKAFKRISWSKFNEQTFVQTKKS